MKRHVFIFLGTFLAGAVIAFGARAALHDPHAGHVATTPATASETPAVGAGDSRGAAATPMATEPGSSHGSHGMTEAAPAPAPDTTKPAADAGAVNTVCAICGMKVNPKIPTETYQGKKVGFGCGACPAQFRANPDKYGPAALRNEVVED